MGSSKVVNFGKSMIVPSVQELAKHPISSIPSRYVRPDQHPSIFFDDLNDGQSVPVIDVESLLSTAQSSNHELEKLHSACQEWGFFQITNHGVSECLLENLRSEITEFFKLPLEEKKKL